MLVPVLIALLVPGEMSAAVHLLDISLVLSLYVVFRVAYCSGFVYENTGIWFYVLYGLK